MAHTDSEREQQAPPVPEYDRFGFQKSVGSYRDSDRESDHADWSRPWSTPRTR